MVGSSSSIPISLIFVVAPSRRRLPVDEPKRPELEPDRLLAEHDVRDRAERVAEREILVDGLDPVLAGRLAAQRDRLAVDLELAAVGRHDPGEDLHERALPRAVVADQADALARIEFDGNVAKRLDAGVELGDADAADGRCGLHGYGVFLVRGGGAAARTAPPHPCMIATTT